MNTDKHLQRPVTPQTQDARDLLARLYREIGISAVAAALQITEKKEEPRSISQDIPISLRNDIAA